MLRVSLWKTKPGILRDLRYSVGNKLEKDFLGLLL